MKNTSFKRLWTKTSVRRMLRVYKKHESSFLCNASSEFANLWDNKEHKKQIIELAQKFNPKYAGFGNECKCLFYAPLAEDKNIRIKFLENKNIRIKFLENEIVRLTNQ